MWKIYIKGSEGIAIQSTVDRLKVSFHEFADTVYMAKVEYVVDHSHFHNSHEPTSWG